MNQYIHVLSCAGPDSFYMSGTPNTKNWIKITIYPASPLFGPVLVALFIFNIILCYRNGGNLVSVLDEIEYIDKILPTAPDNGPDMLFWIGKLPIALRLHSCVLTI